MKAWHPRWLLVAAVWLTVLGYGRGLGLLALEVSPAQQELDATAARLSTIRQLHFKRVPPLIIETPAQARQTLARDVARDISDRRFALDARIGAMLTLYPRELDLKAVTLSMLRSEVVGFYDSTGGQMVLVQKRGITDFFSASSGPLAMFKDPMGQMLIAHELTHALQDQNFGIERAIDRLKDNDDAGLALKSVAEGDATLAGFAYSNGGLDQRTLETITSHLSDVAAQAAISASGAPASVVEPFIFEYTAGTRFVGAAYQKGGWAAVDALYRNPPRSTQEILHPGRYLGGRQVQQVVLSGYEPIFPGWSLAESNTMGELGLRLILAQHAATSKEAEPLAQAWNGDRLLALEHGSELTVIWMVMFDDDRAASRFAAAYASILDDSLGADTPHRLDYRGGAVLTVMGAGAAHFRELAATLWAPDQTGRRAAPNQAQRCDFAAG